MTAITIQDSSSTLPFKNVTDISQDSRTVKTGSLFFAIPGEQFDGTLFIKDAIQNGAQAIVVEKNVKDFACEIPILKVDNVRKSFASACQQFYNTPSENFYLCGITGTNGKTTLSFLLQNIWSDFHPGLLGTIQISYPGFFKKSELTTTDAKTLQCTFADMVKAKTSHVAMEVSSHALEQCRTYGSQFDAAVFTNLTQDHLDYHKTMENYLKAKTLLFTRELVESQKPNRLAVLNADDPAGLKIKEVLSANFSHVATYSLENSKAKIFTKHFQTSLQKTEIEFVFENQTFTGQTQLIGTYNVQNYLAALLVADHSQVPLETAIQRLEKIQVPGRMEKVGVENCYVDYAHTPDALRKALLTLQNLKGSKGRLIVVFGCGGDRDKSKRPQMGKIAAELADKVVITSDNPRTENPRTILDEIAAGIPHVDIKKTTKIENRRDAIQYAIENKSHNDILLVAGKGHEDYQILGAEKFDFDDRKVIAEFL